MNIRLATNEDRPAIWKILEPVIRAGETYALDPKMGRGDALDYWLAPEKTTFVAEEDGQILGTYYLRTNQPGGGSHVCNCGYMTSIHATGKGIARAMCQHSIEFAKAQGYLAMQFNFVVSSNHRAVKLWQSFGFKIVGRIPKAFQHPVEGFVDALVMFKTLT
ncbi:N-acetyltransferase family protein [Methylobacillus pratensis]